MDRLLFVVGTGAAHIERAQTAHANNLANVATTGFKADFAQARSVAIVGDGFDARHYALAESPGVDFAPGPMLQTGRDLDVAIAGDGFFTLATADGAEAYSRAGDLQVNVSGQLLTGAGHQVMGINGPIAVPPFDSITVGKDGTLSIRPQGQGPETLVQAGRLKLVNLAPQELAKRPDGLFARKDGLISDPDISVRVTSGFLEGSNVNAVSEMTSILGLARQFEIEVRLMRMAEENDESSTRLLQIG